MPVSGYAYRAMWDWVMLVLLLTVVSIPVTAAIPKYYMDLRCGSVLNFQTSNLEAIRLRLTSKSTYKANADCSIYLQTYRTDRYMLYFKSINIESSTTCNRDWLEVRNGPNLTSPFVGGLNSKVCGYSIDSYVHTTSNNSMTLRFVSDRYFSSGGFDLIITSYHTGLCSGSEYTCDNGRCIANSITCNGYNPCGDYSDCPLSAGAIAGIVLGAIFAVAIASVLICIVRRRRIRRVARHTHIHVNTSEYGSSGVGYNQPVPQQYPSYPTGQAPPPQGYPTGQPGYPSGQAPPSQGYPQYPSN